MTETKETTPDLAKSWKMHLPFLIGFLSLVVLIGGVGYWSVQTKMAGAVVSSGVVEVQSHRQVVQHPDGGVVGDILVRDGDVVSAGELLLRLDGTFLTSELTVVERQLHELWAGKARLEAERDGLDEFIVSEKLAALASENEDVQDVLQSQKRLFLTRILGTIRETTQLRERIEQIKNQIAGTEAQLVALNRQLSLIARELEDMEHLLEQGLTPVSRVLALQREEANLQGQIGRLNSEIARLKGQIATIEIEILRLRTSRQEEAMTTLRELGVREIELVERRLVLLERLSRLDIRAPVTGTVYGSMVFAVNAVMQPAEPMMYVVPQGRPLVVSAKVDSIHIDQLYTGQPATLRFSAFNDRQTPEIEGKVVTVSADVFVDEVTGQNYYRAEIIPTEGQIERLGNRTLLPGMPVEAMIKTDERTPLSYIAKPLTDYFTRAFRG
ncbi:HlyD family type I secretion periplasmic adaptor subunit [Ruegeria atlantica]|uniref:HlyD family type I secretion periplasmic adaptor subunit n=1 Tax=Ruegeria atlantica TaxID=81569 RepID=UPI00147D62A3|nr:HlyD family type I secretion periplasmic adaptor subunit [Ruegeria atlantica]